MPDTQSFFSNCTDSPKVVVVILNWNGMRDTLECLASVDVLNYPNYLAVVVDNGSFDESVEAIRTAYPHIQIIETGRNLGYAGGNNVGMQWAINQSADYILLLNNDTVVDAGLLDEYVKCAENRLDGALFSAKIFYFNRPTVLWNAGSDWLPLQGCHATRGSQKQDDGSFDQVCETAYANGCAFFARADVLREVGFFDESFFLIYEETDLSYRVKKAGYKIYYVPTAKLWHKVSASLDGDDSPIARYFNARNQLLWSRRHLGWLDRLRVYRHVLHRLRSAFFPRFHLGEREGGLPRSVVWGLSSWWREVMRNLSASGNHAELMGLRDYFLARFGDCPQDVRSLPKQVRQR
ncbi:MAG: glycosyltransferase family 2 protein [Pseudomonadota bacterium]|nr:glycosyltransferase family 2 protein [Pseudomonadota bacterium]